MRRRVLASCLAAGTIALVLGTPAWAADGDAGFSPVDPHSPNAERIQSAYWIIFGFAALIFVGVMGALGLFVWRYRSRTRDRRIEGAQVHGDNRLELAWTALPVVILVAIGAAIFYYLPGIKNPPSARADPNQVSVEVVGHRFYWLFRYPNGVVSIDRLRAPADTVVNLRVTAPADDVIHSWWVPALAGKVDAIPGRVNRTWFRTGDVGTYRGQCAELCGIQHAVMEAAVDVVPRAEYEGWLATAAREQASGAGDLGAQEWAGACATCHGMQGRGLVGPAIAGNPLLQDRAGFETLIREGRGEMPPIAQDWSEQQVDALFAYVSKRLQGGGGGSVGSPKQPAERTADGG